LQQQQTVAQQLDRILKLTACCREDMLTTPTKTDTYIHEVVTHQQQEQKIVIPKKGLFILNWKQISNKNLHQQSILKSLNSSTT
jgi:hypothetical protein